MKLYVAGPMTGMPRLNFPAFRAAAASLYGRGFDVLDPSRHGGNLHGYDWADYMRLGLGDVLAADGVALLPCWENSKGATLEVHVAQSLAMPVRPVADWLAVERVAARA